MRIAALLVVLAIPATVLAGAQCAVRCVRPVGRPPCHHSPEKVRQTCDSSLACGEIRAVTVVEAPATSPAVGVRNYREPAQAWTALDVAAEARVHPPGGAGRLVLRI